MKTIAVLDVELESQRRLVETLGGAKLNAESVASVDELGAALIDGRAQIALIAFEALWPEPQVKLRNLRKIAPNARLLVAYSDVPRERLGRRLWSIGLIDYFLPRSAPPHELASTLRQALADVMLEDLEGERLDPAAAGEILIGARILAELGAALANQASIEGITRELHMRLPRLLEYSALQVLVLDESSPVGLVHGFQTRAIHYELLWRLSESLCAAISSFMDRPLTPDDLSYADGAMLQTMELGDDEPDTDVGETRKRADTAVDTHSILSHALDPVTVRLVHSGELVGCIALMPLATPTPEQKLCLRILATQLSTAIRAVHSLKTAEKASLVDELTSAHNRRYLARVLPAEWRRARRYKLHLSVVMIDIDWFKRLNDEWGHLVGDAALRVVVSTLREGLRDTDHVVRYGGEEFLLLLPETDVAAAALVVERLRMLVHRQPIPTAVGGQTVQITISAGIAAIPAAQVETPEQLIQLADQALLVAKRAGRDRLCVANQQDGDTAVVQVEGTNDKRRYPRVPAELQVRYVPLPDFPGQSISMRATDFSTAGVGVSGGAPLKHNSYALVYFEHAEAPVLSQVMWTRDGDTGEAAAGLRFLRGGELDQVIGPGPRIVVSRALVVLSNPRMKSLVGRVLQAARYDGTFVDDVAQLSTVDASQYSVVLIGNASPQHDVVDWLRQQHCEHPPRLVLVKEDGARDAVLQTVSETHVEHLVGDIDSEQVLFATLSKLVAGNFFGLTKYLMWGAEPKSWALATSAEKADVLAGIRKLAMDVGCHPRVCDLLIAAVDEMIVNALTRTGGDGATPVIVDAASDSRLFGVAVTDTYGRLSPDDVFASLNTALSYQRQGVPPAPERMGLGFWIMLNTLSQLAINVDPGHKTEIIGIIDLDKSLRELRMSVPSLSMFSKK